MQAGSIEDTVGMILAKIYFQAAFVSAFHK